MIDHSAEQMQLIEAELLRTLRDLQAADTLDDRRDLSEIIKNLAAAQGTFLSWMASVAAFSNDDDDWEEDDFYEDDEDDEDDDDEEEDDDTLNFPRRPHD